MSGWGVFAGSWSSTGDGWLRRVADAFAAVGCAFLDGLTHVIDGAEHVHTIGCGGLAGGCDECWADENKVGTTRVSSNPMPRPPLRDTR